MLQVIVVSFPQPKMASRYNCLVFFFSFQEQGKRAMRITFGTSNYYSVRSIRPVIEASNARPETEIHWKDHCHRLCFSCPFLPFGVKMLLVTAMTL